jgi:hypothetical protein
VIGLKKPIFNYKLPITKTEKNVAMNKLTAGKIFLVDFYTCLG